MAYENMYSSPNIFTAMIDEQGTIWEAGTGRKRQAVGVDCQREQELLNQITELQEKLTKYYNRLVELGEIQIPKSPEEIAQAAATEQIKIAQAQAAQQAEINTSLLETNRMLLETVSKMNAEMGELKNGYARLSNTNGNQTIGQNSESAGTVSNPSKKRDDASTKTSPGDNAKSNG